MSTTMSGVHWHPAQAQIPLYRSITHHSIFLTWWRLIRPSLRRVVGEVMSVKPAVFARWDRDSHH